MAAVAPTADQATDMLKNMSLDSHTKPLEIPEPAKKVSTTENENGQTQPLDRSVTPLIPDSMDPTLAYFPNGYASTAEGVYGDMYHGYGTLLIHLLVHLFQ